MVGDFLWRMGGGFRCGLGHDGGPENGHVPNGQAS